MKNFLASRGTSVCLLKEENTSFDLPLAQNFQSSFIFPKTMIDFCHNIGSPRRE